MYPTQHVPRLLLLTASHFHSQYNGRTNPIDQKTLRTFCIALPQTSLWWNNLVECGPGWGSVSNAPYPILQVSGGWDLSQELKETTEVGELQESACHMGPSRCKSVTSHKRPASWSTLMETIPLIHCSLQDCWRHRLVIYKLVLPRAMQVYPCFHVSLLNIVAISLYSCTCTNWWGTF